MIFGLKIFLLRIIHKLYIFSKISKFPHLIIVLLSLLLYLNGSNKWGMDCADLLQQKTLHIPTIDSRGRISIWRLSPDREISN